MFGMGTFFMVVWGIVGFTLGRFLGTARPPVAITAVTTPSKLGRFRGTARPAAVWGLPVLLIIALVLSYQYRNAAAFNNLLGAVIGSIVALFPRARKGK